MAETTQVSVATLAECRPELFEPLVGKLLIFEGVDGQDVGLELLEMDVRPRRGHTRDPFSLLFELKHGHMPGNNILRPKFPGFAPEGWFISRVSVMGGTAGIAYCEAVFG
jgi:hypothetical protein